jgi:hypothetical protein
MLLDVRIIRESFVLVKERIRIEKDFAGLRFLQIEHE